MSDQFDIDLGALPGLVRGLGDRARDADDTIDDAKDLANRLRGLGGTATGLAGHASDAARYIDHAKTGLFSLQTDLSARGQRLANSEGYPDLAKAIAEAAKPPPKHHWYDTVGDVAGKAWDVVSSNPMETLHTTLDVVGFIPVVGDVADGVNALIYIAEGDWANAAISGISIVPFVGSAAAGARLAAKGVKVAKDVSHGVRDVDHAVDIARTGRHAVDAAQDGRHAVDAAQDGRHAVEAAQDAGRGADAARGARNGAGGSNATPSGGSRAGRGSNGTSSSGTSAGSGKPPTATELRNSPGRASGGSNLDNVSGRWFNEAGTQAPFPKQIADQLRGRDFKTFGDFREAFWDAVSKDPELSKGFNAANRTQIEAGNAPFAPGRQQVGGRQRFEIHHVKPISEGSGVYNLDNLVIVTPRQHIGIHNPK